MPGVTKEQIRQAREADLFAYLERHERGVLKRDGPNYRHKEHDSLVYVTAKNYWYWNSRGKRINALDYLMEIRGYGLVDAVNALAGSAMQYSFPSRDSQDYAAARQARKPDHCYLPWQTLHTARHSLRGLLQEKGAGGQSDIYPGLCVCR